MRKSDIVAIVFVSAALASTGAFCFGYHNAIVSEAAARIAQLQAENASLRDLTDAQATSLNNIRLRLYECREAQAKAKKIKQKPQGMYQPHLRRTIRATLQHLHADNMHDWERLLLLTIVTESDCGAFTRQLSGPARGITQMEPTTEHYVLSTLRTSKPKLYAAVRALRVPAHLSIHEAEYNTAYSIALTYALYTLRHVDPKGKTTEQLIALYKKHYNTNAGKATHDSVMQKLTAYALRNL